MLPLFEGHYASLTAGYRFGPDIETLNNLLGKRLSPYNETKYLLFS
jgi:hypothetical protein